MEKPVSVGGQTGRGGLDRRKRTQAAQHFTPHRTEWTDRRVVSEDVFSFDESMDLFAPPHRNRNRHTAATREHQTTCKTDVVHRCIDHELFVDLFYLCCRCCFEAGFVVRVGFGIQITRSRQQQHHRYRSVHLVLCCACLPIFSRHSIRVGQQSGPSWDYDYLCPQGW